MDWESNIIIDTRASYFEDLLLQVSTLSSPNHYYMPFYITVLEPPPFLPNWPPVIDPGPVSQMHRILPANNTLLKFEFMMVRPTDDNDECSWIRFETDDFGSIFYVYDLNSVSPTLKPKVVRNRTHILDYNAKNELLTLTFRDNEELFSFFGSN